MSIKLSNVCVYTALIGDYEQLNEQQVAARSDIRFICFTDDPNLSSPTWECRTIKPVFPMDPIRSQRDIKIRPHVHLPEFDGSLYIDNSVILSESPEEIWKLLLPGASLLLPQHSFRETVMDEFLAVSQLGLDDQSRIFEQLNHYALHSADVLNETPYWCAIMARDHRNPQLRLMMEIWMAHVSRYSRRDQLSVNVAMQQSGLKPQPLIIDNFESSIHRWPVTPGRYQYRGVRNPIANLVPLAGRVRALEQRERDLVEQNLQRENEAAERKLQHEGKAVEAKTVHDRQLAGLEARHREAIVEVRRLHVEALDECRAQHAREVVDLRTHFEGVVTERRDEQALVTANQGAEISALQQQISMLMNATTWRATAPIRNLLNRLRATFGN